MRWRGGAAAVAPAAGTGPAGGASGAASGSADPRSADGRQRIVVLRPSGTTVTRIPFNYNKVIAGEADQANFYLQPGDIILVP